MHGVPRRRRRAGGAAAPNLSHFADPTHTCFAGCNWSTEDREALAAWLENPDAVKLGAKMPDYELDATRRSTPSSPTCTA